MMLTLNLSLYYAGDKWHKRRKILTSAFHFNVLQKYMDIILEQGDKTVQALKAEGESVQSLLPFLAKYTLNVICGKYCYKLYYYYDIYYIR